MSVAALIQARTGSTRLPGKTMYPLCCRPVLEHVLERVAVADTVDYSVVTTSDRPRDDIIELTAKEWGAEVVRGPEDDVLKRMHMAAMEIEASVLVRVCADNPLLSPAAFDAVVTELRSSGADYVSTLSERTLPVGLDAEAFSEESFNAISKVATQPHQREHVTVFYREHPERFEVRNVTAEDIFERDQLHDRTDLRLTLDEAADYRLLSEVYETLYDGVPVALADAIDLIDDAGLHELNRHVRQKSATRSSS